MSVGRDEVVPREVLADTQLLVDEVPNRMGARANSRATHDLALTVPSGQLWH